MSKRGPIWEVIENGKNGCIAHDNEFSAVPQKSTNSINETAPTSASTSDYVAAVAPPLLRPPRSPSSGPRVTRLSIVSL